MLSLTVICIVSSTFNDKVKADLDPTGMAKPVADLRDYNGTYYGSPGTGTIGYNTLYRDNYNNSPCAGEGCGSHPGVDIDVDSNTNVYNSREGWVEVAGGCSGAWGNHVVVRSTNPWNTSETIRFTYAHLREISTTVTVGSFVTTGQYIGKSGGFVGSPTKPADPCHGTSTGAHLHFQVDRDDGNSSPYFPTSSVDTPDNGFTVTTKTYNPVVFVTGGYRWTFWQNNNRELWDVFNWASWGVSGGALWMDGVVDPYVRRGCNTYPCDAAVSAESSMYKRIHLNMYNHCVSNPLTIFFTTSNSATWDPAKSVTWNLAGTGPADFHVSMNGNGNWSGIITGIRVDPATGCGGGLDPTYYGNITIER